MEFDYSKFKEYVENHTIDYEIGFFTDLEFLTGLRDLCDREISKVVEARIEANRKKNELEDLAGKWIDPAGGIHPDTDDDDEDFYDPSSMYE